MSRLVVYVDGCCNKRNTGWAVIIPSHKIIYRGDIIGATNQKAELSAIIQAVHRFSSNLHIITDSMYSINCFTIWYPKWLRNGWKDSNGNTVTNKPLVELGLQLGVQNATYEHVKGHSNHEYNDMADYYSKNNQLLPKHVDWTLMHG
jgi:ribonuclease HI